RSDGKTQQRRSRFEGRRWVEDVTRRREAVASPHAAGRRSARGPNRQAGSRGRGHARPRRQDSQQGQLRQRSAAAARYGALRRMAYRNGTYVAFHAEGLSNPAESDMKYFRMLTAWHEHDGIDFRLIDSHEKTGALRDSCSRERLRDVLAQRL